MTPTDERIKRFHSKSRNGCQRCKNRRIKCTEEKPGCAACRKKDLRCEYQPPRRWMFESGTVSFNSVQPKSAHLSIDWRTTKAGLDFRYFLEESLPMLQSIDVEGARKLGDTSLFSVEYGLGLVPTSSRCIMDFWGGMIPQMSYNDPNLWKLVTLYGEQHRAAIYSTPAETAVLYHTNYAKALSFMLQQSKDPQTSPATLVASSMILFAFQRLAAFAVPVEETLRQTNALFMLVDGHQSDQTVQKWVMPVSTHTFGMVDKIRLDGQRRRIDLGNYRNEQLKMPAKYGSAKELREWFKMIYKMPISCSCDDSTHWTPQCPAYSILNERLEVWYRALLKYYHEVQGNSPEEAKLAFQLMSQYSFFMFAYNLSSIAVMPFDSERRPPDRRRTNPYSLLHEWTNEGSPDLAIEEVSRNRTCNLYGGGPVGEVNSSSSNVSPLYGRSTSSLNGR